jgi:hypothetical protein
MVFAIAETVEAAEALCLSRAAKWHTFGTPTEYYEWTKPLGQPTRIVDLPCAEWHEWSE